MGVALILALRIDLENFEMRPRPRRAELPRRRREHEARDCRRAYCTVVKMKWSPREEDLAAAVFLDGETQSVAITVALERGRSLAKIRTV
jgi:hypothetical protein